MSSGSPRGHSLNRRRTPGCVSDSKSSSRASSLPYPKKRWSTSSIFHQRRGRMFASLPELELASGFCRRAARDWIRRIRQSGSTPSPQLFLSRPAPHRPRTDRSNAKAVFVDLEHANSRLQGRTGHPQPRCRTCRAKHSSAARAQRIFNPSPSHAPTRRRTAWTRR